MAECDGGGRGARWEATCKAWHASLCPMERRRVLRAWRGSSLVHASRLDAHWSPQVPCLGSTPTGAMAGAGWGRHDGRRLGSPWRAPAWGAGGATADRAYLETQRAA